MKIRIRCSVLLLSMTGAVHAVPTQLTDAVQVDVGANHACVVTTAGGVKCWGGNLNGQLGDGTSASRSAAGDVIGLSSGVAAVATGRGFVTSTPRSHSCALMLSGGVKCWGLNDSGQLGDGTTTNRHVPVDVVGFTEAAVAISAGWNHTCALLAGGGVVCWGANGSGQLGDATTSQRSAPTPVFGLSSGVVDISAGPDHTCAVTGTGAAKCWGSNTSGQLGDGTTINRSAPVDVSSLSNGVAAINAGGTAGAPQLYGDGGHTCTLMSSGGVKCWGANGDGQVGNGSNDGGRLTPIDVVGLTSGVVSLSTGGVRVHNQGGSFQWSAAGTSCASTESGGAKCWGSDWCGLLGDGGSQMCLAVPSAVPVNVEGLSPGVAAVSTGGVFACALMADKRVNCWGSSYGAFAIPAMSGPLPQAITIGPTPTVPIGGTRSVSATGGGSGNPVTFLSLTPSICTMSGSTVTGLSGGMCTLTANQAGNAYFDAAAEVVFDFRIGPAFNQTITFGPAPMVTVNGVGKVSATASSGLSVTFRSNTPSVCLVSGDLVTGLQLGSCTVAASQPGDELYAPAPEVTQTFAVTANPGTFILSVAKAGGGSGTVTSSPAGIDCGSTCAINVALGASQVLTATPGADSFFVGWSGACTGTGVCNVTMTERRDVSATFKTLSSIPRLTGISTRGEVLTGDDVMIGGFVIAGLAPKTVIVRARGPSLAAAGIVKTLIDPALQLVRASDQAIIATNDDWGSAANAAQISATGFGPSEQRESAILMTLEPGAYTAIVSGSGGTTGVGIVEIYEVDHPEIPLSGISTRGRVLTGSSVMIGGFIVQGEGPQTMLIRARGPSLASAGVPNALANPTLQLYLPDGQLIASNDDWESAANAQQIPRGFAPGHALEAAIYMPLPPGGYTAVVSGVGSGTGVAIVEVIANP